MTDKAANPSAATATGATAAPVPAAAQPAAPSSKAPEPTAPSPAAPSPAPSAAAAATPAAAPDPRLAQLHRVMLMMLKDFAALCEKEGLRWYAAFGTAIGALRHAGFVPWDDDIDLYMPRTHLDRLVQAAQQGRFAQRYCVVNASLDARYPLATTRVMLRETEFRDEALASRASSSTCSPSTTSPTTSAPSAGRHGAHGCTTSSPSRKPPGAPTWPARRCAWPCCARGPPACAAC